MFISFASVMNFKFGSQHHYSLPSLCNWGIVGILVTLAFTLVQSHLPSPVVFVKHLSQVLLKALGTRTKSPGTLTQPHLSACSLGRGSSGVSPVTWLRRDSGLNFTLQTRASAGREKLFVLEKWTWPGECASFLNCGSWDVALGATRCVCSRWEVWGGRQILSTQI